MNIVVSDGALAFMAGAFLMRAIMLVMARPARYVGSLAWWLGGLLCLWGAAQ